MIYLDHAATSMHKPPQVYDAVLNAMKTCASIGRSGHHAARVAADTAYQCRCRAAAFFDCRPDQVVFTTNATHGLNIAINTLVHPGDRVVISGFEHNAVVRPLYQKGADIVVAGQSLFDPADTLSAFEAAVSDETKAVVCTHVSNVFGYVLPVEKIAEICHSRKIPFILDASQSAGVLPVSLHKLGAAFIAMPGHKSLLGPQGTGLLLCGMLPKPLLCGGTGSNSFSGEMPDFLPDIAEAGTHNIPGIAGLSAAIEHLRRVGTENVLKKERTLLWYLSEELSNLDYVRFYCGGGRQQTGVLSFQIPQLDCEIVGEKLGQKGIAVRAGLHCAPLAHQSANTIKDGTVRISFSSENSTDDIEILLRELRQIII